MPNPSSIAMEDEENAMSKKNVQRIVVNRCWGGFSLSRAALHHLRKLGSKDALAEVDFGEKWSDTGEVRTENCGEGFLRDIKRDDPLLLQTIDDLGAEKCSGELAELEVREIPVGVDWEISDYDGMETVAEKHRTW